MGILSNIEPKEVFQYFEELSMVPRSTFHTKKISDFCVEFAKAHNEQRYHQKTWYCRI